MEEIFEPSEYIENELCRKTERRFKTEPNFE